MKGFVKGLAAGTVLAGVAVLLHEMKGRDMNAKEVEKAAMHIKNKVTKHAKKLGKLSKAAYGKIVETTVAEYRGVKALSEDELSELRRDLKAGWEDVRKMVTRKRGAR